MSILTYSNLTTLTIVSYAISMMYVLGCGFLLDLVTKVQEKTNNSVSVVHFITIGRLDVFLTAQLICDSGQSSTSDVDN